MKIFTDAHEYKITCALDYNAIYDLWSFAIDRNYGVFIDGHNVISFCCGRYILLSIPSISIMN